MKLSKIKHPSGEEVIFERISGFLSSEQEDRIEEYFLHNKFPWFYHSQTVTGSGNSIYDDFGFLTHNYLLEGEEQCPDLQYIINLVNIERFMEEYEVGDGLYNAHANLFLQRDRSIIPHPHIDFWDHKHTVVLYYINDCDGDTIFYNKSLDDELIDVKEWRRESPKKGDFLVFDGSIYHSPTCPIESKNRFTLNFDCEV